MFYMHCYQPSPELSTLSTWNECLHSQNTNSSSPLFLGPGNHHFTFCDFDTLSNSLRVESYNIVFFCNWLFHIAKIFIYVGTHFRIFKFEKCSIACIGHILSIQLPVHGHLGCFHLWPIVNNAAEQQNMVCKYIEIMLVGSISRSRIAGAYVLTTSLFFAVLRIESKALGMQRRYFTLELQP